MSVSVCKYVINRVCKFVFNCVPARAKQVCVIVYLSVCKCVCKYV